MKKTQVNVTKKTYKKQEIYQIQVKNRNELSRLGNQKSTPCFKEIGLTIPSISWMSFFFLFPALLVASFAFRKVDIEGTILPLWTTNAFNIIFQTDTLIIALRTIILSALSTAACIALAIPVSYSIACASPKQQRILLLLVVIPLWSCFLVRIFAWKTLLHPEGFIKSVLVSLSLMHEQTNLLYNNVAVFIVMVYSYLPFAIIPLYSAASKFNFRLFEAAMDLGATHQQAFLKVFLPFMRRAILTASLLVLIPTAGAYVIPDVVGGHRSEMLGNLIARKIFVDRNLPEASALTLLLSWIILIPALFISIGKSRLSIASKRGLE